MRLWPHTVVELMNSVSKDVGGKLHSMRKYAHDLISHILEAKN